MSRPRSSADLAERDRMRLLHGLAELSDAVDVLDRVRETLMEVRGSGGRHPPAGVTADLPVDGVVREWCDAAIAQASQLAKGATLLVKALRVLALERPRRSPRAEIDPGVAGALRRLVAQDAAYRRPSQLRVRTANPRGYLEVRAGLTADEVAVLFNVSTPAIYRRTKLGELKRVRPRGVIGWRIPLSSIAELLQRQGITLDRRARHRAASRLGLSIDEAATALGVSRPMVDRLIQQGHLHIEWCRELRERRVPLRSIGDFRFSQRRGIGLSAEEAALQLGVSPDLVVAEVRARRLPGANFGYPWGVRISGPGLRRFIRQGLVACDGGMPRSPHGNPRGRKGALQRRSSTSASDATAERSASISRRRRGPQPKRAIGLSPDEVADRLGVTRQVVMAEVRAGRLAGANFGPYWGVRIPTNGLRDFISRGVVPGDFSRSAAEGGRRRGALRRRRRRPSAATGAASGRSPPPKAPPVTEQTKGCPRA